MSLRRARPAIVIAVALLLGLAPLATASNHATQGRGTTSARLKILDVELTNVPVTGDVAAALGIVTGDATTADRPFASIALEGVRLGNQNLAGETVTSDDADNSKQVSIPLAAAGVGGSLTIAELAASATNDSATSTLKGLEGELALDALGLTSIFGGQGIDSLVTPVISTSDAGVDIGPIALQLGDLLPAEVLEALPFSTLVALAGELDLEISGALDQVHGVLTQVNDLIDEIQTTIADLDDAQAELDALIAGTEIEALQAEVDAAAAAVADATTALQQEQDILASLEADKAALEAELAVCLLLCDALQAELDALNATIAAQEQEVAAAETTLADATAVLEDAEAALAAAIAGADAALQAANELVDQLQAELEALLAELEDLLLGLPDLSGLIGGAIDALAGAPLVTVGRLKVGVESLADAERGIGDATCSAEGVNILGTQLGAMSCGQLRGQFDELQSGIWAVLSDLPVAGSVPQPTVRGLAMSESGTTAPGAKGRTTSDASITALRLGIPSLELKAVIDTLVADLTQQIEDLLAGTPLEPALNDVITTVLEELESLPTGELLAGLRTVGVEAAVGGLRSTSEFLPRTVNNPTDPDPDPGTDPGGNPTGTTPVSNPQASAPLPFTGGDHIVAFLALALLAIVAGTAMRVVPTVARPRGRPTGM